LVIEKTNFFLSKGTSLTQILPQCKQSLSHVCVWGGDIHFETAGVDIEGVKHEIKLRNNFFFRIFRKIHTLSPSVSKGAFTLAQIAALELANIYKAKLSLAARATRQQGALLFPLSVTMPEEPRRAQCAMVARVFAAAMFASVNAA